jgi:NAD+ kinase
MAQARPHVLILGDRRRPGVSEGVARHLPFLSRHLEIDHIDLDDAVDLTQASADLVLVFGGDGSILHVARRLGQNPIPVLGVNYGRFGFLADVAPDDLEEGIRRWLAGDFLTSRRTRLRVRYAAEDGSVQEWLALNDVVVGRRDMGRMVDVNVHIDGHAAISYSGDGLILATATGSTAHALSAGGPLLDPTVDAVVMVPIAPHSLATRPLVLAGSHRIELTVRGSRTPGLVTVDGAPPLTLGDHDRLEVIAARSPLSLVRVFGGPFYEALRAKLGWRGRPVYASDRMGAPEAAPDPAAPQAAVAPPKTAGS